MAKIVKSLRGNRGAMRLDASPLNEIVDRRMRRRVDAYVGVVTKPAGEASHYELNAQDVLVWVELQPTGNEVQARLASVGGGANMGLWRVPAVGTEVAVLCPGGRMDFMPIIVGVLSSGQAPERMSDQRTILVANDTVEVTAPRVVLGPAPADVVDAQDGFVHGRGVDSFTGSPYFALGNTSQKVLGNK